MRKINAKAGARIRKGRASDARALVALYSREPAVSDFAGLHTIARFQHLARSRGAIFLVAEQDGRVIGALDAEVYSVTRFSYFANLVVSLKHRRQGVGRQLMEQYEQICRRRGVRTILALVYDWNSDMHPVMRRTHYRNNGRLVEYIKRLPKRSR